MRANAILAEGSEFDLWVDDVTGVRIEIAQTHAGDLGEVTAKATAEMYRYRDGQTEITVGVDPETGDPVFGEDLFEGDEVYVDGHWREVEAYAAQIDDETGRVVNITPQFGVVLDSVPERISRTFRSLGGLNGGTSHLARPTAAVPPPNIRP